MSAVWCVRHRDGWCATKDGRKHDDAENNVATKCEHFVVLPWGAEKREPTCNECKAVLS